MFISTSPIVRNIIILNIILFLVVEYISPSMKLLLSAYLPISPHFEFWQIVTHMFVHNDIMHLVFNMFTLWSFGNVLEQIFGQRKFLILYFLSGLGAFILFNIWNYYQVHGIYQVLFNEGVDIKDVYLNSMYKMPEDTELTLELKKYINTPMLGASGAVFGIMAGFCLLFPNNNMYMMFIPFPIKAKYFLIIIMAISVYLGISNFSWDNIAHFAHIGGALVGYVLVRNWKING